MNGPTSVYRLKPVYQIPEKIPLPDCMYSLKNPGFLEINLTKDKVNEGEVLKGIMDKTPTADLSLLEARWDKLIEQLSDLKLQMTQIREAVKIACHITGYQLVDIATLNNLKVLQGAVINANPSKPPYSLFLVKHIVKSSVPIIFYSHIHSSVSSLPDHLKCFQESEDKINGDSLKLLIIWKSDLLDTELVTNPVKQLPIKGEVNIIRFLAGLGLKELKYPDSCILKTTQLDASLDLCHRLYHSEASKEKTSLYKNLSAKLGKSPYFGGNDINIVDICAWSVLKQINLNASQDETSSMTQWFQRMDSVLF